MDTTDNIITSEEIIISDNLEAYNEIIVEDCTVEIQSSPMEPFIAVEDQTVEIAQTIEIETPIEIAETTIKTEVIEQEELLIPTAECEIEIDQDINEFECIYIKDQYFENITNQEQMISELSDSESSSSSENKKPFFCQLCERPFKTKSTLNAHMLWHASEKFFCAICDKSFKKKTNLNFHMRLHSTENSDVYNCTSCSKTFTTRASLVAHSVIHKNPSSNSSPEKVTCNICNKSFQKSYLKIHMTSHMPSNDYTCTFCSKNLSSKQSLYMHMNTVHANEGCYECSYCAKRFFWKSYLDRHITVHTKEKSHHCTFCTKAFTRKLALRKHLTTHVVKGKYCIV